MAEKTKIQWTDSSWNPWRGCTKISPGCTNCYAETLSGRNPRVLGMWGPKGTRVLASESKWNEPAKWNETARIALENYQQWVAIREGAGLQMDDRKPPLRPRVFCASLADVFEDWGGQMTDPAGRKLACVANSGIPHINPTTTLHQLIGIKPYTLSHARKRLWKLIQATPNLDWLILTKRPENITKMMPHGEWGNVWLGVSVENEEFTWRCDALQEACEQIKVPVRFVSYEPALGAVDFSPVLGKQGINWVIIGGESGGGARPFQVEWARNVIKQCRKAKVAPFMKQVGKIAEGPTSTGRFPLILTDPKGGNMEDWPEDLRVREFPI